MNVFLGCLRWRVSRWIRASSGPAAFATGSDTRSASGRCASLTTNFRTHTGMRRESGSAQIYTSARSPRKVVR